jgi:hypothetical protein
MVCAIKGGPTNPYAVVGGLDDRILLSMESAAEFMPLPRRNALFFTEATDVQTMFQS